MKKFIIAVLILACLITCLAGCKGEEKPENIKILVTDNDTEKLYDIPSAAEELKYDVDFTQYITIPDYRSFELEYSISPKTDKAIDNHIYYLLLQKADRTQVTDRPAAEGDVVTVSYTAVYYGTGNQFADEKNVEISLGRGIHIPALEEAIVGMSIGETKVADIVYPADNMYKDLASTKTTFTITLSKIETAVLPELNAETIRSFNFGDAVNNEETLKEYISAWIDEQNVLRKQDAIMNKLKAESVLVAMPSIEYQYYKDLFEANATARAESMGISLDSFITTEYGSREAFDQARDKDAQEKVFEDLIIYALKEEHGIEVTKEEYNTALKYLFELEAEGVGITTISEFHEKMGSSVYKSELILQVRDALSNVVPDAE